MSKDERFAELKALMAELNAKIEEERRRQKLKNASET